MHLLFLAALIGCAFGETINKRIAPGGQRETLMPKLESNGRVDTTWRLTTDRGAKMVLLCALTDKVQSCRGINVDIWDGQKTLNVCDMDDPVAANNSIQNEMSVTIKSNIGARPAYCQVRATVPFMNFVDRQIDSSEHGQPGKSSPTCRCGWTNKKGSRIVGGKQAGVNEYPFPALIMETVSRGVFCGGSIITSQHVLTAAHCTYPKRRMSLSVVVGEHDITKATETKHTQVIKASRVVDHEDYDPRTHLNDISIMYLESAIKFSDFVGPVCLPSTQDNLEEDYIKVMGWGHTSTGGRQSPVLLKVNLKVVDLNVCGTIYSINTDQRTQLCTYNHGKDSCQGDSGGPLVWIDPKTNMYQQVGVVSYGRECASTDPGVNTKVSAYLSWIRSTIRATKQLSTCS